MLPLAVITLTKLIFEYSCIHNGWKSNSFYTSDRCNRELAIKMCYGDGEFSPRHFGILRIYIRTYVNTFRNIEQGV